MRLTVYDSDGRIESVPGFEFEILTIGGAQMTMSSVWLKQCPRCGKGDLYVDNDIYGESIVCLQCAWRRDVMGGVVQQPEVAAEPVPVSMLPKSERDPGGIAGNISPRRRGRGSGRSKE